jgi:phosphoglycerol transferase
MHYFHGKKSIFLMGFIIATALFGALTVRNLEIYPIVMSDEYNYSKYSRLLPLADAIAPSYLYLAIYRATNLCGDGFYDCAKIFNALFFVASAPFIYLTARRTCSKSVSSFVALFALLEPINSYTAYYMPEALFFFSFWLLTWFILRLDHSSSSKSWCFAGILLGLSALVKPHALFFLPAIVLYILYVSRKKEGKWVLKAFKNAGAFIVFSFLSKFLIGYLVAGGAGVTLFGPFYQKVASSTPSDFQHYLKVLALFTESIKGHVLAICLMFGVPIAVAINASLNSIFSETEIQANQKISFYSLAVLVSLILIAALYTATTVANAGAAFESIARIHMRYYNFAFPLLLVIAASQLSLESTTSLYRWRAIVAFPIGIAILYAIYMRMAPYWPNYIDSPELRGFTRIKYAFYILGALSFIALALWVYSARFGARIFVFLIMPLAVAYSTHNVNMDLKARLIPDVFDKAGIFTKQYLSNEDLSKLVVVSSDGSGVFRSLFFLDNPQSTQETIPKGSRYDLSKLPAGKEWILLIGDHSLSEKPIFQLPMDGFTLVRVTGTNKH